MWWINCFSFSCVCNHPASFAGSTHLPYVFPSSFPLPLPSISLQISVASPLQPDVDVHTCSPSIRWPSSELLCHCCCACVCVDITPSSPYLEWAQDWARDFFFFTPHQWLASHAGLLLLIRLWWHSCYCPSPCLWADLSCFTIHSKSGLVYVRLRSYILLTRKEKLSG